MPTIDAATLPGELAAIIGERRCDDVATLAATPAGCIASFAMTQLDISATRLRALLAAGKSVRYLLPDSVLDYINLYQLYRSP